MKLLYLLVLTIVACAQVEQNEDAPYLVDAAIYQNFKLPAPVEFASLSINLREGPFSELHRSWIQDYPEAKHLPDSFRIDALTAREYALLSGAMGQDEVKALARRRQLQNSRFTVRCIGEHQIEVAGKEEQQYFIVVSSSDLLRLRIALQQRYQQVKQPGAPEFAAANFWPYIKFASTRPGLAISGDTSEDACVEPLQVSRPFDGSDPLEEVELE